MICVFFQGTPEGQSLTPINLHILKVNKQLENLLKKTFWRNFLYFDSINLDFSEPLASWRWDPWPKSLWDSQRSFKVGRLEINLRTTDDRILIATKGFKCCSNLLFFQESGSTPTWRSCMRWPQGGILHNKTGSSPELRKKRVVEPDYSIKWFHELQTKYFCLHWCGQTKIGSDIQTSSDNITILPVW